MFGGFFFASTLFCQLKAKGNLKKTAILTPKARIDVRISICRTWPIRVTLNII